MKKNICESWGCRVLVLLLLFGMGACAGKTQVILLPDQDGKVGQVVVENQKGEQVLDKAYQGTEIAGPDVKPADPVLLDKNQVQKTFKEAMAIQPTPAVTFKLYFKSGTAELTEDSKKSLPQVLQTIKTRNSNDISVIGHTDRAGDADKNAKLALTRAKETAETIMKLGVDPKIINIESHGEENPVVPTADGVSEEQNRRVEITVR